MTIPTCASGKTYTIKSDETCDSITQAYNVSLALLFMASQNNNIRSSPEAGLTLCLQRDGGTWQITLRCTFQYTSLTGNSWATIYLHGGLTISLFVEASPSLEASSYIVTGLAYCVDPIIALELDWHRSFWWPRCVLLNSCCNINLGGIWDIGQSCRLSDSPFYNELLIIKFSHTLNNYYYTVQLIVYSQPIVSIECYIRLRCYPYLDCRTKGNNIRALNITTLINYTTMTHEIYSASCVPKCPIYGLEYAGECYCGNN